MKKLFGFEDVVIGIMIIIMIIATLGMITAIKKNCPKGLAHCLGQEAREVVDGYNDKGRTGQEAQ